MSVSGEAPAVLLRIAKQNEAAGAKPDHIFMFNKPTT